MTYRISYTKMQAELIAQSIGDSPTTNMKNLQEADAYFKAKGAEYYHDVQWPPKGESPHNGPMFRHYFAWTRGAEIGYVIPAFFEYGSGVHEFGRKNPRIWYDPGTYSPLYRLDSGDMAQL